MTELSKAFEHQPAEAKWYQHWLDQKYFASTPDDREPYTIVMPPPNVTGVLHMGHCLNNTIQDILIRRARMQGKNACWVPGTDHASIATEAKVVQMLRERGITKSLLSRDEFLSYAWEWKEKYGGIILQQLKKLGFSLDWDRTTFTMDPDYYQSVIKVFVDLYNKGFIYRGKRMINWDPAAKTALSDEEVIFKETNSKLYHVRYEIVNSESSDVDEFPNNLEATHYSPLTTHVVIATVRPETILGDTAIAVNPKDERFKHLHGKYAIVPLIGRKIPVILDEYVAMDFGTGALKVTPAHDANDYALAEKHNLDIIDIMNDDGTFNADAQLFIGEDRFVVRKKIIPALEEAGNLVKIEDYTNQVGFSERNPSVVVEKRLSLQWWLAMKNLSNPALKVVMEEAIQFVPEKFKNLYRHWMENIKDWCISRQLWWGQRIPAWYDEEGRFVVAENEKSAKLQAASLKLKAENKTITEESLQGAALGLQLRQDEDCLDTWFSSWLWPSEVFKGVSNPGNAEVKYYYPTNTLVTAPEIIFFWVARMIMAGLEYEHEIPFKDVYFTGIVRDEQGRKMSKSLGNSPDLLALIDKYGADAVRFGIMIASPAGNDLMFDVKEESTLKDGSFFINKMWNALKLLKMWEGRQTTGNGPKTTSDTTHFATTWFAQRLQSAAAEIDRLMAEFNLSEALKRIKTLIWDDFCSWYLEWIKPGFEQPIEKAIYEKTVGFFTELMQLLHPYMPFVTEEIYHLLAKRSDDLCNRQEPKVYGLWEVTEQTATNVLPQGELLKKLITALREARDKNKIKPKETIELFIETAFPEQFSDLIAILAKQINASKIEFGKPDSPAITVAVEQDKFFIISSQPIDTTAQKETLLKDLEYQQGFLVSVMKKLSNEKFMANAKADVIANEEKKKADAEARIKTLQESLASLT